MVATRRTLGGMIVTLWAATICFGGEDEVNRPGADSIRQALDRVIHALEKKKEKEERESKGSVPLPSSGTPDPAAPPTAATALVALQNQLQAVSKYEHGERELKGEVGGGFSGDDAPIGPRSSGTAVSPGSVINSNAAPDSNYKIDSSVTLTRGTYPQRFRVRTSVGVLLSGRTFQEDVSSLLLSYGHYTSDSTEIYGFAERITDSYLSIDQRWEVGGGAFIAWRRGLTKAAAKELVALCSDPRLPDYANDDAKVRSRNGWGAMTQPCLPRRRGRSFAPKDPRRIGIEEAAWANEGEPPGKHVSPSDFDTGGWDPVERAVYPYLFDPHRGFDDAGLNRGNLEGATTEFYKLKNARENAIRSLGHVGARMTLGMAFSLFAELERSTIGVLVDKDTKLFVPVASANTESKAITLDGAHSFRVTVRPTIRFRPSTHLYLEALAYAKQRLWPTRSSPRIEQDEQTLKPVIRERNDIRVDAHGEVRYILVGGETVGGEKFSVIGSYDLHYDRTPPFVATVQLSDQGVLGVSGDGLSARRTHHVFKIQLAVGWGGE